MSKRDHDATKSSDAPAVQKFDIGGTMYTVSRSLLEQHPNTMLCSYASKRWKNDEEEDTPLFIDRNGRRFEFVLDYMRDGKVTLPKYQGVVSKASLLADLEYFGFQDVNPESIEIELPFSAIFKCNKWMQEDFKTEQAKAIQRRDQALQQLEQVDIDIACMAVAHACASRLLSHGENKISFYILKYEYSQEVGGGLTPKPRTIDSKLDYQAVEAVQKTSLTDHEARLNVFLAKYELTASNY
ncbi:MAG: hypothetical protein SGARI_003947, partial [Bacillariaceae sp.]